MAYKKPQIVAKSDVKQTYVAGCPANTGYGQCYTIDRACQVMRAK